MIIEYLTEEDNLIQDVIEMEENEGFDRGLFLSYTPHKTVKLTVYS